MSRFILAIHDKEEQEAIKMLEAGGVDVNERDWVSAFSFSFPHFASFQPVQEEEHACYFGFWTRMHRPTQALGRKGGQYTPEGQGLRILCEERG